MEMEIEKETEMAMKREMETGEGLMERAM